MAIRRLNYTGRRRLRRADVRFTVYETDDGSCAFDASLSLKSYRFPSDALVFVEAYRQTTWMRFPFGRVGRLQAPLGRRLTEFDTADGVRFRVRVTSAAGPAGLELAEADGIRPRRPEEKPEERIPLLSVVPAEGMGEQIFRVDFEDRPVLVVNAQIVDWREAARAPAFISLVCPAALREILVRVLYIDNHSDTEDPEDWRSQWLRFGSLLPGVGDPPSQHERDRFPDWIDEAVASFCRKFTMLGRFSEYWSGESTP